jgi:hypothetical protein
MEYLKEMASEMCDSARSFEISKNAQMHAVFGILDTAKEEKRERRNLYESRSFFVRFIVTNCVGTE